MTCIFLRSSAVRVHDSQAYRKLDVTFKFTLANSQQQKRKKKKNWREYCRTMNETSACGFLLNFVPSLAGHKSSSSSCVPQLPSTRHRLCWVLSCNFVAEWSRTHTVKEGLLSVFSLILMWEETKNVLISVPTGLIVRRKFHELSILCTNLLKGAQLRHREEWNVGLYVHRKH